MLGSKWGLQAMGRAFLKGIRDARNCINLVGSSWGTVTRVIILERLLSYFVSVPTFGEFSSS